MEKIFAHGFVLLAIVAFAACSSSSSSTEEASGDALSGLDSCTAQASGTICGTLLAPDGTTPIANAEITVAGASGSESTTLRSLNLTAGSTCLSDATGAFACACNDTGESQTFTVDSVLIDFEFTATCAADEVTNVDASETTAESTEVGGLAIVTGSFDKVEVVLADLLECGTVTDGELDYGTECDQMHIFDGGARISDTDTDPNNGDTTYRTIDDLLTDTELMDDYSVILLNCGLDETLSSDATVIANIQDYIENGGHIYASDWAYLFVEEPFPDLLDFYGDTSVDGLGSTAEQDEARVGEGSLDQTVNIEDASLLSFLRDEDIVDDTADTATVNFNLGSWVVMSNAADDVTQLLTTDDLASLDNEVLSGNTTIPIAALSCGSSTDGGIFYGSYHTEIGEATDEDSAQEAILRYMILNGFNGC